MKLGRSSPAEVGNQLQNDDIDFPPPPLSEERQRSVSTSGGVQNLL